MAQQAYICLTEDNEWAVVTGDGSKEDVVLLAVGRQFEAGADIREAVGELEAWARENGYEITTPEYALCNWSLQDLIEPEVFEEVFGDEQE